MIKKNTSMIDFYCKRCKKSFKAFHVITGNDGTPVMSNFGMKCHHCARVVVMKKYTERDILEKLQDGKFFL